MKRRELIQHLEKHGCCLHRQGKKHTVYVNPHERRTSTVPRHREIPDELAKKICKDLGLAAP